MGTASDPFEVLGLPRRYDLSGDEVEARYLARSRELHPDFHQLAAASEQRASLELTAVLNEAYSTLRDPFRRAEALLALEGGPSAAEHKQMSPDFLEEMLELRMHIEELREGGDPGALAAMETQLQDRRAMLFSDIASRFGTFDSLPAGDRRRAQALVEVRQLLNAAKYIQGQLRDLRAD